MTPVRRGRRQTMVAIAIFVAIAVATMIKAVLYEELYSPDGAFQTYAAVSAFASGQALGRDFQSYLGALMPLALTPLYLAGGSSFAASCAAAAGAVFAGLVAMLWVLLGLSGARGALRWRLLAPATLLVWLYLPALLEPGSSLRPLRWSAVAFTAFPVHALFRRLARCGGDIRKLAATGALLAACAAIAILWSNDVGVPIALAIAMTTALLAWRTHGARALLAIGPFLAAAPALTLLAATILTQGDVGPWASYTFGEIPQAQVWMFAPWGDANRVSGLQDLPKLFADPLYAGAIAVCTGTIVWSALRIVRRRGPPAALAAICFFYSATLGGGLLPQISGHIEPAYGTATLLAGWFAPLVVTRSRWLAWMRRRWAPMPGWARSIPVILGGAAPFILLIVTSATFVSSLPGLTGFAYEPVLKAWVPPAERPGIAVFAEAGRRFDARGTAPRQRMIFDYPSALSIAAGAIAPTPYPSVIHALGAGPRAVFIAAVAARTIPILTTVRPRYSGWVTWNMRASWPIFRAIIENYRPVAQTAQHVIWRPRRDRLAPPATPITCTLRIEPGGIRIEVARAGGKGDGGGRMSLLAQADVTIDMNDAGLRRWFWTIRAPATRPGDPPAGYWNAPFYGAPPGRGLSLLADLRGAEPYLLLASPTPARIAERITQATCHARAIAEAPDYDALPPLRSAGQLGL